MKKDDFKNLQKAGKVEYVDPTKDAPPPPQKPAANEAPFDFSALLEELKTVRRAVSATPTYTPKNFLEQFVLYESGATRRLYIYVNRSWRYVALT